MTNIGFCGAHRTGKTTAAIALSQMLNIPYLPIHTKNVFLRFHVKPEKNMDFRTRLEIQEEILAQACDIWRFAENPFICDRTPIDMMAYLLADIQGQTLNTELEVRVSNYLKRCHAATTRFFSHLFLFPNGVIPLVFEDGKASLSDGYIEHIHALCVGLFYESDVDGYRLSKDSIEVFQRVQEISQYLLGVGFIDEVKNVLS
jgi:hypothetical protein